MPGIAVSDMRLPLVVTKQRTRVVTAGQQQSMTIGLDMKKQSLSDVQNLVRFIYLGEAEQQKKIGNPVSIEVVDGSTGKRPIEATRIIVGIFGAQLARAAMGLVQSELQAAIRRSTNSRTGALANVSTNWQWLYLSADGSVRSTRPGELISFKPDEALILRPIPGALPYAWMVNTWAVSGLRKQAGQGRLQTKVSKRAAAKGKRPQNIGFMRTAVDAIRRKSEFRQFHVKVSFGRWDRSAINLTRLKGGAVGPLTPCIIIRPRTSTVRG